MWPLNLRPPSFQNWQKQIPFLNKFPSLRYSVIAAEDGLRQISTLRDHTRLTLKSLKYSPLFSSKDFMASFQRSACQSIWNLLWDMVWSDILTWFFSQGVTLLSTIN